MRRLALTAAVVLAGCGSTSNGAWAPVQSVRLGWREPPCGGVRIRVARLTVERARWRVEAAVANDGKAISLGKPHTVSRTYFGIARADRRTPEALHSALLADRFSPPLPRQLDHGASWSGTYTGRGRLPLDVPLRLVFGRFTRVGESIGFLCVSTHEVRL